MGKQSQSPRPLPFTAVGFTILALTASCMLVESKPMIMRPSGPTKFLIRNQNSQEQDQLIAMPSEGKQYTSSLDQQQHVAQHQQQEQNLYRQPHQDHQHIEYLIQYHPAAVPVPAPAQPQQPVVTYEYQYQPQEPQNESQPAEGPQQQVVYVQRQTESSVPSSEAAVGKQEEALYVLRPDGQLEPYVGTQQQQGYEYVTIPSTTGTATETLPEAEPRYHEAEAKATLEYPGEILYIGQNGEKYSSGEMAEATASYQPGNNVGLSNVANMISKSSGLPATILTEVPIKDMPYDVLERLKSDYGVKVVANRERPGANLVINCDEYSGLENAICARPPQDLPASLNSPYAYGTPDAGESHHATSGEPTSREQPQLKSHPINEVASGDHTHSPDTEYNYSSTATTPVYDSENHQERPQLPRGLYMAKQRETHTRSNGDDTGHHSELYGAKNYTKIDHASVTEIEEHHQEERPIEHETAYLESRPHDGDRSSRPEQAEKDEQARFDIHSSNGSEELKPTEQYDNLK